MSDWRERASFSDKTDAKLRFYDARVAAELREPTVGNRQSTLSPSSAEEVLKYIVTSPNMSFVPRPCLGTIAVSMKADAKFGRHDPVQWPQEYIPDISYCYISCIPRPTHPRRRAEVWRCLKRSDMQESSKALRSLFTVKPERTNDARQCLDELEESVVEYEKDHRNAHHVRKLQLAAENAYDRLFVPATLRDLRQQFVVVERFYCMTLAWLIWERRVSRASREPLEVDERLMGSFTTSPEVAQKYFQAGIPVWFLRLVTDIDDSFVICGIVDLTEPSDIEPSTIEPSTLESSDNVPSDTEGKADGYSSTPIYVGTPGPGQVAAICFRGSLYIDVEPVPFPSNYAPANDSGSDEVAAPAIGSSSSTGLSVTSTAEHLSDSKKKKAKSVKPSRQPSQPDRSKFVDLVNPRIPPLLPAWKEALSHVEAVKPTLPQDGIWGYWTPDPALVVGSDSEKRRERYTLNWLRVRGAWYYITRNIRYRKTLFVSAWRLFLDDGLAPSATVHRSKVGQRRHLLQTLTSVFGDNNIDVSGLEPMWFDGMVTRLEDILYREIAWELSEVGFMVELLMLDAKIHVSRTSDPQDANRRSQCIAQVFPSMKGFQVSKIPDHGVGLSASGVAARGHALEGLRALMLEWPGTPQVLRTSKPLDTVDQSRLKRMEAEIARFYVETFVKAAGRPPILPRYPPHTLAE